MKSAYLAGFRSPLFALSVPVAMLETLSNLPLSFWVALASIGYGMGWAHRHLREGFGLPVLAVVGTVAVWYVGDVLYNDYQVEFMSQFTPEVMDDAWWQVTLFVIVLLVLVPVVHRRINKHELNRSSHVLRMLHAGVEQPRFQSRLHQLLWPTLILWMILNLVAAIRLENETINYFFPFLSGRVDPWSRGRIGGGIDALLTLANYFELFVAGVFGTLAALLKSWRLRLLAMFCCLLSWPYFIFDRTRNPMLAVVMPAILAWVFLRVRGSTLRKTAILFGFFVLISAWFAFIIANRSQTTITDALQERGFSFEGAGEAHHAGLDMYQELCWINTFITEGSYKPNWGRRYFAELVNPIPRSYWPGKPLIGVDYAILRGQQIGNKIASDENAGIGASVTTGMIGQGVVNYGRVFGPAFAALLMSLWVAVLARLDLRGDSIGRIPLYGLGLILTFNLGRDITLMTLYTFVFGALIVWLLDFVYRPSGLKRMRQPGRTPQNAFRRALQAGAYSINNNVK